MGASCARWRCRVTITDIISRLRGLRTMHGETLPPPGPLREAWRAERAAMEELERQMLERLNAQRAVRG